MAAAAPRTLSPRQLNRALLTRQLLLARSRVGLPRALERIGGLQAQYAPSMYIGLWSRVEAFRRDQLDRALERRSVVQGTLMRSTIHLVSARDYWPFAIAVREARRESWAKAGRDRPAPAKVAAAARRLRAALARGPLSRAEIDELLGSPGAAMVNGVGLWLDLVRVPPGGTWQRRRADIFAAAEEWLGAPPDRPLADCVAHIVRRYLQAFGPAAPRDIADWAGLPPPLISRAVGAMRLRRFRDEDGEELYDLPRAQLPGAEEPAPVRFLPVWDATLLVHTRRTGILPEEHRPRVFNPGTPHSVNTFLVDGVVSGTWRHAGGRVEIEPFGRLDRSSQRALRREADGLAALHG